MCLFVCVYPVGFILLLEGIPLSHPWMHARSSVKKHGGHPKDYLPIHQWFDDTKEHWANWRHRALRHHSLGIFWCEKEFGPVIRNSEGKDIPTRILGEQHVLEDLGWIPTVKDWLQLICTMDPKPPKWAVMGVQKLDLVD